MSFVNSIATTKGGRHVDHVADAVIKAIIDRIKKSNKTGINIKNFQVCEVFISTINKRFLNELVIKF